MVSLEMIGYYSERQSWSSALLALFYPSRGDFVAVVGRHDDRCGVVGGGGRALGLRADQVAGVGVLRAREDRLGAAVHAQLDRVAADQAQLGAHPDRGAEGLRRREVRPGRVVRADEHAALHAPLRRVLGRESAEGLPVEQRGRRRLGPRGRQRLAGKAQALEDVLLVLRRELVVAQELAPLALEPVDVSVSRLLLAS